MSPRWRGAGPLAGVAAGLARAGADGFAYLATAPCDAPFLPLDLVARLMAAGEGGAAVAISETGLEPMFALLPVSALARVEAALEAGRASPRSVLEALGARAGGVSRRRGAVRQSQYAGRIQRRRGGGAPRGMIKAAEPAPGRT